MTFWYTWHRGSIPPRQIAWNVCHMTLLYMKPAFRAEKEAYHVWAHVTPSRWVKARRASHPHCCTHRPRLWGLTHVAAGCRSSYRVRNLHDRTSSAHTRGTGNGPDQGSHLPCKNQGIRGPGRDRDNGSSTLWWSCTDHPRCCSDA